MTAVKPPRVRGVARDCVCPKARHEHGTGQAYRADRCGCDACLDAVLKESRARAKQLGRNPRTRPVKRSVPAGWFIVTFEYHGGWTRERLRRTGDLLARQFAVEQDIRITGPLTMYVEPKRPSGLLLVVQGPATTSRPVEEVAAAAERFAEQHRQTAPHIARWAFHHARKQTTRPQESAA